MRNSLTFLILIFRKRFFSVQRIADDPVSNELPQRNRTVESFEIAWHVSRAFLEYRAVHIELRTWKAWNVPLEIELDLNIFYSFFINPYDIFEWPAE